jgi:hypothetical protein
MTSKLCSATGASLEAEIKRLFLRMNFETEVEICYLLDVTRRRR